MRHSGVYLTQLLCPARHCVLAGAAYCADSRAVDELALQASERFEEDCRAGLLHRECGLCHSRNLHWEMERTRFATMEEARPTLEASAEAQRQTAAFWKAGRN